MKKRILITSPLPGCDYKKLLENDEYEVKVLQKERPANLNNVVKEYLPHAVISLLSDKIDGSIIKSCNNLEIISNYAVGFNNIDVNAAIENGTEVTNTPGVLTDATADIAFMLMLMCSRRALEAEEYTRSRQFTGWEPKLFLGSDLKDKTVGLVGFGRIGQAVAKRANGFGMRVCYNKRNRLSSSEEKCLKATYKSFDELIKTSDIISLHLPYTRENHHMFNEKVFHNMKNSSIFINTARGNLVDERSLANSLHNGVIKSAGLDVFEKEPEIDDKLFGLKNCVLLPHIGSATVETREEMASMVILDVLYKLSGQNPKYSVLN